MEKIKPSARFCHWDKREYALIERVGKQKGKGASPRKARSLADSKGPIGPFSSLVERILW
jgi:hypothetical protein